MLFWFFVTELHSVCNTLSVRICTLFFYFVSWFCDGMCSRNDSVWWLTTDHIAHSPPMSESIWFMLTPQMVLLSGVFIYYMNSMHDDSCCISSHLMSTPFFFNIDNVHHLCLCRCVFFLCGIRVIIYHLHSDSSSIIPTLSLSLKLCVCVHYVYWLFVFVSCSVICCLPRCPRCFVLDSLLFWVFLRCVLDVEWKEERDCVIPYLYLYVIYLSVSLSLCSL